MAESQVIDAPVVETPAETKPVDDGVLRFASRAELEEKLTSMEPKSKEDFNVLQRLMTMDNVEVTETNGQEPKKEEPETPPEPPAEFPKEEPKQEEPTKPDKQGVTDPEIERLRKRNEWLDGDRNKHLEENTKLKTEAEELKKKAETPPVVEPVTPPAPKPLETVKPDVGESKLPEIRKLQTELAAIPAEYRENAEYVSKIVSLNALLVDESERNSKLASSTQVVADPKTQEVVDSLRKDMAAQNKRLEDYDSKRTQDTETAKNNEALNASLKEIADFQNHDSHKKDYATSKPIAEVEKDFFKLGQDLYYAKYNVAPQTAEQIKDVIYGLKANDVGLSETAKKTGIAITDDVNKYMEVMDLWRIKNSLPDVDGKKSTFELAMQYKAQVTGVVDKAVLAAKEAGANAVKKAMTQDNTTAKQMPPQAGGTPQDVGQEMTEESAKEVIKKIDVGQVDKNPALKAQWLAAMKRLGIDHEAVGIK